MKFGERWSNIRRLLSGTPYVVNTDVPIGLVSGVVHGECRLTPSGVNRGSRISHGQRTFGKGLSINACLRLVPGGPTRTGTIPVPVKTNANGSEPGVLADPALRGALLASPFGTLPPTVLEQLAQGAERAELPAASTLYREAEAPGRVMLVVSGLARVFMTSTTGRQVTVRYAHRGDLLGVAALLAGPPPASVQALTDSELLLLSSAHLHDLSARDAQVALVLAQELAERLYEVLSVLAGQTFGTVRARLARHLLELAAAHQDGPNLRARVSQQELADAVGSVREVVARTLHEWRALGFVATGAQGVELLDPGALHQEAERAVS